MKFLKKFSVLTWICLLWVLLVVGFLIASFIIHELWLVGYISFYASIITVTFVQIYWVLKGNLNVKLFSAFTLLLFWSSLIIVLSLMMGD